MTHYHSNKMTYNNNNNNDDYGYDYDRIFQHDRHRESLA